jgi:hypothetical protein
VYQTYAPVPIGSAVVATYRWAFAVVGRHPAALFLTALASVVFAPFLGGASVTLLTIPLVLVTQNEVIRGPSRFDQAVLGKSWGRVFLYFFDTLLLGFMLMAVLVLPAGAVALIGAAATGTVKDTAVILAIVAAAFASFVVMLPISIRLSLRLPSRSINRALTWSQAWELGRGHTWGLFVASFMVGLPLVALFGIVALAVHGNLVVLIALLVILLPFQIVIRASFLALAYLHCVMDMDRRQQMVRP